MKNFLQPFFRALGIVLLTVVPSISSAYQVIYQSIAPSNMVMINVYVSATSEGTTFNGIEWSDADGARGSAGLVTKDGAQLVQFNVLRSPWGSVNLLESEPSATQLVLNLRPTGAGGRRIECTVCAWAVGKTYTLLLRSWRSNNQTHVALWYRQADTADAWLKVGEFSHSHPDASFQKISSTIVAPENSWSTVQYSKGWVRWLDDSWHPMSQAIGSSPILATSTDGQSGFLIRHWPQTSPNWSTRTLALNTQGWQAPDFPKMTVTDSVWQLWPTFIDIFWRPATLPVRQHTYKVEVFREDGSLFLQQSGTGATYPQRDYPQAFTWHPLRGSRAAPRCKYLTCTDAKSVRLTLTNFLGEESVVNVPSSLFHTPPPVYDAYLLREGW